MKMKPAIIAAVAFAALSGAALQFSLAKAADADPAPDDQVATEALNSVIADCNKSQDERFKAQQVQFEQAKQQNADVIKQYQAQNETLQKQYDVLRTNYTSLAMQNDEERKQTEDLQHKYQDMQRQLQDAQAKYDDIVKKLTPPEKPDLIGKLKSVF
ncbi:MAG: hypothetical protein KGO48_06375 [Alphaproteobacteria bacterium]|nr:hypothetical protein [Alphaproteobacteria bacterium]